MYRLMNSCGRLRREIHEEGVIPSLRDQYIVGKTISIDTFFQEVRELSESEVKEEYEQLECKITLTAQEYECWMTDSKPNGDSNIALPEAIRDHHNIL